MLSKASREASDFHMQDDDLDTKVPCAVSDVLVEARFRQRLDISVE